MLSPSEKKIWKQREVKIYIPHYVTAQPSFKLIVLELQFNRKNGNKSETPTIAKSELFCIGELSK